MKKFLLLFVAPIVTWILVLMVLFISFGGLKKVEIEDYTTDYEYSEGLRYYVEHGYGEVCSIGTCTDSIVKINYHDNYDGVVEAIAPGGFANATQITRVEIPEGVRIIWPGAFDGCTNLTSMYIPYSVTVTPDTIANLNSVNGVRPYEWYAHYRENDIGLHGLLGNKIPLLDKVNDILYFQASMNDTIAIITAISLIILSIFFPGLLLAKALARASIIILGTNLVLITAAIMAAIPIGFAYLTFGFTGYFLCLIFEAYLGIYLFIHK